MKNKNDDKNSTISNKQKKHRLIALFISFTALLFVGMSFAWYVILFSRSLDSKANDIMAPYYLYLLNNKADDYLQLTIGNLHPGEVKQEIICVSNKQPGEDSSIVTAKNSTFEYELELAHTENLPVNYSVYELVDLDEGETQQTEGIETVEFDNNGTMTTKKKVLMENPTDVSNERKDTVFGDETDTSNLVNAGKYMLYQYDLTGMDRLKLTTSVQNNNTSYENDYYVIEIEWQQGIQFSNYTKETDLIYVIVKALQAKPLEK